MGFTAPLTTPFSFFFLLLLLSRYAFLLLSDPPAPTFPHFSLLLPFLASRGGPFPRRIPSSSLQPILPLHLRFLLLLLHSVPPFPYPIHNSPSALPIILKHLSLSSLLPSFAIFLVHLNQLITDRPACLALDTFLFDIPFTMAAATTADVTAGTRRPVVRSEKFVEWQRELSSIRATYGGRRRYDVEAVTSNGVKKHPRKSEDEAVKEPKNSEERDAKGEHAVTASQGDMSNDMAKVKKQQQRHRPESKTLQKDMDLDSKKAGPSKRKEASDPLEGGRQRRRRQSATQDLHLRQSQDGEPSLQNELQTWQTQAIDRGKRQMFSSNHELQGSRRNESRENTFPTNFSYGRGSKRSRRLARRLANEEPQPQPLKLPKLHLVLTRKEIQEDWFKITGQRYSGKPRKSTILQLGLGLCTSLTCPSTIRYLNDPQ